MKKILLILTGILVIACATEDKAPISGTAPGVEDGFKVYLTELGENNARIPLDTATVISEKFNFSKPIPDGEGILILTKENEAREQLLLLKDQEPVVVTLYKDSLETSVVSGSKSNELFSDYRLDSQNLARRKQNLITKMRQAQQETDGIMVTQLTNDIKSLDEQFIQDKKKLVENFPNEMVAAMALSDLLNAKVLTVEESDTYFTTLGDHIKQSAIGASINRYVAQLKSQRIADGFATVGKKAPSFSAPTPDGKVLSLEETLGKYTIIDFWASWCRPCRMENPNVVNVYNEYHDKGLNIISVSLDRPGQKDRWLDAIQKDNMDWYHVSNLNYWQDPIPKSYGVRAIPATFLLDENGVIIAKNLRGPALGAKMKELLGEG